MTNIIEVKVPDIGDAEGADIIEILVAVGDNIEQETPLIVLETDKATMEVPSSQAGVVTDIAVTVGNQVSNGDLILTIEAGESESDSDASVVSSDVSKQAVEKPDIQTSLKVDTAEIETNSSSGKDTSNDVIDITVPDIGDAADVDVIEVLIIANDSVEKEQSLIVLETDKATMEVPSSSAGVVTSVSVNVGDKVSQGDVIGQMKLQGAVVEDSTSKPSVPAEPAAVAATHSPGTSIVSAQTSKEAPVPDHPLMKKKKSDGLVHASPSVRRFARELGADLTQVTGTGIKARIVKEDVQKHIKFELSRPKATASTGAFAMPEMPTVDHAKWGEIESRPLSRIQKISSVNLHRNWITIPHVTQHEDADITELDAFRKSMKDEALKEGIRLTPLAFIMKGLVHTLKAFPKFNASLDNGGENLIIKNYYHIGVAVETPDGLTVPVIRDVDKKGIYQLANELGEISAKAREKKLSATDMQGSSFTISSLGGIGGTAFSPIVKWPDVAILGLSRNSMQPVWNGKEFEPRLMLPMSLSYDHRVIDGADAARFVVHLAATLKDIRRVLLN
ncbi:MAG: dihydrolipoyllysine-residue acetyltransferase [Kangiellaceae bacterium]|nr:dihydrolipoyllysine-residue acetyltransferase [Kangiellaceae bacterium]